ncbi:hypothetical protein ACX9NE_02505 [Mycobacterium sp. ML4]
MSQWLSSPKHPAWGTRQSWLVDQVIAGINGVAHAIVNPGYFADNYLRLTDFAAVLGLLPVLTGDRRSARNRTRVIRDFLRTPLQHGLDPRRYVVDSGQPTVANGLYAMQDEQWKARVANQ